MESKQHTATIVFLFIFSILALTFGLVDARTYGSGGYGTGQYGNDTTAPSIASFSCSPTTVNPGATVTCSCSATDDSGIDPTVSYTVKPSTSSAGKFIT